MNKILAISILGFLAGCTPSGELSQRASPVPISSASTAPVAANQCPTKPTGILEAKAVETVTLGAEAITKSAQVNSEKSVGYSFEAKAGNRFNFRTQDKICVHVYTPNNTVLSGNVLPDNGKYTAQISAAESSTSYSIEMGLDSPLSSTPSNNISSEGKLTKDVAQKTVARWLSSKKDIFAPPWNSTFISQYTTGQLYKDITQPGGSVEWLKKYKSYYTFTGHKIEKVEKLSDSGPRPSIQLQITEEQTLNTPDGTDPAASGQSTATWTYFFTLEDGVWKIDDYRKEDS
jgi:hypothetical protein